MEDPATTKPEDWVILARLLRPQGRKGELLADLFTDFPERFTDRQGISLRNPAGVRRPATVESHWLPVGRNAGRIVLKLEGIDTISDAETLAGFDLVVPPEQRVSLLDEEEEADERYTAQYIADLLDCTLFDGERSVGLVHDVHFPTSSTGVRLDEAAPLLVLLSPTGDEVLVPFARSWIESIDIAQKRIVMRLPEGLLDING